MIQIEPAENNLSEYFALIEYKLNTHWVLWKQIPGFQKIQKIQQNQKNQKNQKQKKVPYIVPLARFYTIAGLWDTFDKLSFTETGKYIFMRDGIDPMWEDPKHLNGGYVKIDITGLNYEHIFNIFLLGMIGETLTIESYDSTNITGMVLINEKKIKQIRIWISNKDQLLNMENIMPEFIDMLRFTENNHTRLPEFIFKPFDKLIQY